MTFAASVQNACQTAPPNAVSLDNNDINKVIDTCCLGCVFAQGKFTTHDKKLQFTQSNRGCHMDVLRRMRSQGEELQEATDNHKNEFYVIRGRMCPFHRTPNWSGWLGQDIEAAKLQARKEVQLKPDVVIYYGESNVPNDILDTIAALDQGNIRPARLYIVNNNSFMRPSQIMNLMQDCPLPWRAETTMEETCDMMRALDVITKKCTNIFVTYFIAGYKPPLDFFQPIDTALYDNLDRFLVLEPLPDSINGLTVLRLFHKQAGGNARESITAKAKKLTKEQQCPHLIRPVTEIVTQLSQ